MSSRAKNAESIFGEAIGIEAAADRAAFLDQACAHDSQLRKEVEILVADHFRAGSFMEEPALKAGVASEMLPQCHCPSVNKWAIGLAPTSCCK